MDGGGNNGDPGESAYRCAISEGAPPPALSRLGCTIIGEDDPIELRIDACRRRRRTRRRMRKVRIHVVAIARNPSTTMTAIAHRGKDDPELACCTPPPVDVGFAVCVRVESAAASDEDDAAAAEDDDDAATESSTVVCTAVNIGCGTWFPSSVLSERMMTQ